MLGRILVLLGLVLPCLSGKAFFGVHKKTTPHAVLKPEGTASSSSKKAVPLVKENVTAAVSAAATRRAAKNHGKAGGFEGAVHSLLVGLRKKPEKEPYSEFEARCLEQAEAVVQENDQSYTDINLETNLLNECELERQFSSVHEDGFHSHSECQRFAKKLHEARKRELLDHKDVEAYENFCADYYLHIYPEEKAPPKPPKKSAANSLRFFSKGLLLLLSLGLFGLAAVEDAA